MEWQYHPLLIVFQLGALISAGVALYCARRLQTHGWNRLVGSMGAFALFNAVFNAASTLKVASTTLDAKLLFYKLEFLGSAVNPSVALVLALAYLGYDRWLSTGVLAVLVGIPAVVGPLIVVNPGDVMIVDPHLLTVDGIQAFEHRFPPLFATYLAWGLGAMLCASGLVLYGAVAGTVPTTPAALVGLGLLAPAGVVALKVFGVYPPGGQGIAVTPVASTVTLVLIAVAIGRYRLFDRVSVGRSRVLRVMDDGYVLSDEHGHILDANGSARALLHGSADAPLVGHRVQDFVPDDDPWTSTDPMTVERGGRVLHVRSSEIAEDGSRARGYVFVFRDVTLLHERERALKRENRRLENVVGVVAHDLRNALNVAAGRVDLAQHGEGRDDIREARQAIARLDRLIEDLLVLTRYGQPVDESDRDAVHVATVARTAWTHLDTADATITIASRHAVEAAEERVHLLVGNLLHNAVDHGGEQVTVRVGDLPDGFYVADDGPGIPTDEHERVLEPGYSTRPGGIGFGLSVVREIADAHGWSLVVTDGEEGGARVEIRDVDVVASDPKRTPGTVEEPADGSAPSSPEHAATDSTSPSVGSSPEGGGPEDVPAAPDDRTTVLVVEDNISLRRYVRDLLAPAYRVLEAGNGREGLEHAQASLPDLIVADVMMPRMDGFEMVQALRQQPSTECIPVVMLTARTGDEAHAQGLDEGADAYLTKPFDAPVLIAQIERLLSARKQLRRRLREEIEEEASVRETDTAGDEPLAFDEQVRRAVREHLADPDFSVAVLAEEVALSRSHLTDKVKETLGQTPTALLRSMRLERGAELLASETGTVTEVAYAVGFNSLSYFSRCFKEEYGVPPSSYPNEQAT